MRKRRLILVLLVAAGLSPGIVVRVPQPGHAVMAPVTITPLQLPAEREAAGVLTLEKAWTLASPTGFFGGYSGLVSLEGKALLALSDGGRLLAIRLTRGEVAEAAIDMFPGRGGPEARYEFDLEALTRDAETGELWIATEAANLIQRYAPTLQRTGRASPAAMRDWPTNAGAETLARLSDGRFLVVRESADRLLGENHTALIFAGDPVEAAPGATPTPMRLTLAAPTLFRPVDAAEMPDGRIAVLMRRLDFPFPPRFSSAIAIFDPARIRPGAVWQADSVLRFPGPWPQENYEGLTVEPLADGAARIWVVSDDNNMQRWQATVLLRLRYDPGV